VIGENFSERVRKVLALAQKEAVRLRHEYIGTEHLLLGLIRDGEGVAAVVMQNLGVNLEALSQRIEEMVPAGKGSTSPPANLPQSSRAQRAIEFTVEASRELGHRYIGTEHLLLGLLRERTGPAAQLLLSSGLSLQSVQSETLRLLGTEVPSDRASP